MGFSGSLPWLKIHDYLLEVSSAKTKEEFCRRAYEALQPVIPYDSAAGVFDAHSMMVLYGNGTSLAAQKAYNEYYRLHQPWLPLDCSRGVPDGKTFYIGIVHWNDYRNSEYTTDFAHPNGLVYSLGCARPCHTLAITVHRSQWGPDFTETNIAALELIDKHINNLYRIFDRLADGSAGIPTSEQIADRLTRLSFRESEVLALQMRGLTAPEIASKLFISERTVESHVESIYTKLNVHTKRQAIDLAKRLVSGEPESRPDSPSAPRTVRGDIQAAG